MPHTMRTHRELAAPLTTKYQKLAPASRISLSHRRHSFRRAAALACDPTVQSPGLEVGFRRRGVRFKVQTLCRTWASAGAGREEPFLGTHGDVLGFQLQAGSEQENRPISRPEVWRLSIKKLNFRLYACGCGLLRALLGVESFSSSGPSGDPVQRHCTSGDASDNFRKPITSPDGGRKPNQARVEFTRPLLFRPKLRHTPPKRGGDLRA